MRAREHACRLGCAHNRSRIPPATHPRARHAQPNQEPNQEPNPAPTPEPSPVVPGFAAVRTIASALSDWADAVGKPKWTAGIREKPPALRDDFARLGVTEQLKVA